MLRSQDELNTRHQSSILQSRAGPRSAIPLTRSILLHVSDLTLRFTKVGTPCFRTRL